MASPTDYELLYLFTEENQRRIFDETGNYTGEGWSQSLLSNTFFSQPLLVGTGHAQGYATDGTDHFATSTDGIGKWNSDFSSQIAVNATPFTSLSGTPDHVGGCDYYNGFLYVIVARYTSCGDTDGAQIVRYNGSDLTYDSHVDISANVPGGASGLAINVSAGIIYLCDYCDGTVIYRCDLTTLAYIDTLTLDYAIANANGIAYYDDVLYINCEPIGGNFKVYMYSLAGARLGTIDHDPGDNGCYVNGDVMRVVSGENDRMYEYDIGVTNTAGEFALAGKSIGVPYVFADEGTIIFDFKANRLFNYASLYSPLDSTAPGQWIAWTYSDGRIGWRIGEGGPSAVAAGPITATSTQTVAMTWSGSGGTRSVSIYLNGLLADTQSQAWVTPFLSFFLGGAFPQDLGEATLYNFGIFNRVLNSTEIGDWNPVPSAGAPLFSGPIPDQTSEVGTPYIFESAPYFTTGGAVATYSIQNAPLWMVINPSTGQVTGDPEEGVTADIITITGANGTAPDAVSNTFSMTASAAPVVLPVLSSPTLVATSPTTLNYSVTTDTVDGVMWVRFGLTFPQTDEWIKGGTSTPVTGTLFSDNIGGATPGTSYYVYFLQETAAGDSNQQSAFDTTPQVPAVLSNATQPVYTNE